MRYVASAFEGRTKDLGHPSARSAKSGIVGVEKRERRTAENLDVHVHMKIAVVTNSHPLTCDRQDNVVYVTFSDVRERASAARVMNQKRVFDFSSRTTPKA